MSQLRTKNGTSSLYSTEDISARLGVSLRWVQKLAKEFQLGVRIGRALVFREADLHRFLGDRDPLVEVALPLPAALADYLTAAAESEGVTVEQEIVSRLQEHLAWTVKRA